MFFKKYSHYVYILSCADGTFYTGITWNLRLRIARHNGLFWGGGKYTSIRRPVFLVHIERLNSRKDACKRELEIKAMSHPQKEHLIASTTKEQILSAI